MTQSTPLKPMAAIVLAAGKGTRMKSELPKALHLLCGAPLTGHVLNALSEAGVRRNIVVVGYGASEVRNGLGERFEYVEQAEQRGTGHAALQAFPLVADFDGLVLIAPGDAPLITSDALSELAATHAGLNAACTLLTCEVPDPRGYGRIVRDGAGRVTGIIEDRDAKPDQRSIREIATSFYCFTPSALAETLPALRPNNAQGEFYLTDVVAALHKRGATIETLRLDDPSLVRGVNSRWELAEAVETMRMRIAKTHALAGVSIVDPRTAYIDVGVRIGEDTIIEPMTILEGETSIGSNCRIGPCTRIVNSSVGDGSTVIFSNLHDSIVEMGVRIGPYANIRPGSVIRRGAKIGNFVEVKRADIGEGVSAGHLTYIGDASVGANANIGAGTITCNYDGHAKHRTTIGERAFIGSDTTLVAPVEIGDGAFIAASSVITQDVPEDSLAVARCHQTNKEGWAKRWRERK